MYEGGGPPLSSQIFFHVMAIKRCFVFCLLYISLYVSIVAGFCLDGVQTEPHPVVNIHYAAQLLTASASCSVEVF